MFVLALPTTGFCKEATFSFPQKLQAIHSPVARHSFVKMCQAINTVGVSERECVTRGQLPASGIGFQFDPGTFPDLHVLIVPYLEAETAHRNQLTHGILPPARDQILVATSTLIRLGRRKLVDEVLSVVSQIAGCSDEGDSQR